LFGRADRTVLEVFRLHAVDALLTALQLARFLGGQLAGLEALFDAFLLIHIALLILLHGLSESARAQHPSRDDSRVDHCRFHVVSSAPVALCDEEYNEARWEALTEVAVTAPLSNSAALMKSP